MNLINLKNRINLNKFSFKKTEEKSEKNKKESFFKKLFRKYDYDIDKVIGVKEDKRYILYADKKLLRIYRESLKSSPLLSTYIPIENAIFYNFEVEKNVILNVDVKSFVETKVYEEAGLSDTEEYIVKYKIIDKLKDEKRVLVQTVIVAKSFIEKNYEYILKETGYIDYLSFPAFAYKSLYEEKILKKATDLFIVILYDKIFLTFYDNGELLYINTISGGLDIIYRELERLNIESFDLKLFKKLLKQKGLRKDKYLSYEMPVYNIIEREFLNMIRLIEEQVNDIINRYDITSIDRIFITSEYGDILGLDILFEDLLGKNSLNFEFYEEYNLDRLDIDPFLFLAMLETHYAYRFNSLSFNFSLFLRRPTFFYRPSGILISFTTLLLLVLSIYPIFMYFKGLNYKKEAYLLKRELENINAQKKIFEIRITKLKKELDKLLKEKELLNKQIKTFTTLIKEIYEFKFSYTPKSLQIDKLTYFMNKNHIYLNSLIYENREYILNIYSYDDKNFGNFLNDLINNGFNADFDIVEKKGIKYFTTIRIVE